MNPFLIKLVQKTQGEEAARQGKTPEIPRSWYFLIGSIIVALLLVIALAVLHQEQAVP